MHDHILQNLVWEAPLKPPGLRLRHTPLRVPLAIRPQYPDSSSPSDPTGQFAFLDLFQPSGSPIRLVHMQASPVTAPPVP